jgi:hypothetical protein
MVRNVGPSGQIVINTHPSITSPYLLKHIAPSIMTLGTRLSHSSHHNHKFSPGYTHIHQASLMHVHKVRREPIVTPDERTAAAKKPPINGKVKPCWLGRFAPPPGV